MNRYRDTYKAPRSMLQAFPGHYPGYISRHRRAWPQRIASMLLASVLGAGFALMLFYGLST